MTRSRFDADAVADAVIQPPFSTVAARGGRILRRRRIGLGALAVAAVVLAGVAVPPSLARWNSEPPATDATASGRAFTDTVLADRQTIVMVRRNVCAAEFSVSTDAGTTWSAYRGPVAWRDCDVSVSTVYEILSPTVFAATVDGVRYLSRDTGATWEAGPDEFTVVDAVPEPARLREGRALQAFDPATGSAYQVYRTGDVKAVAAARFAPDGALWVVGSSDLDGSTPDAPNQVVVSTDRGRSWVPAGTLPSIGTDPVVVPLDARRAFVLGAAGGQGTVYRTDDGGTTWSSAAAGWAVLTTATINAAGHLMAFGGRSNGERFLWTSPDDGRTFAAVPVTEQGFTTAGYLGDAIWTASPTGVVAVTDDGQAWHRTAARNR